MNKNIERIVSEINKCLEKELMFAALFMALSLPDLCGKEKWRELSKNNKCHERYVKWFNKYVDYELNPLKHHFPDSNDLISFGAEECYKLRCSLLHAGETDIGEEIDVDSFCIETSSTTFGGNLMSSGSNIVIRTSKWTNLKYINIRAITLVRAILIGVKNFLEELSN